MSLWHRKCQLGAYRDYTRKANPASEGIAIVQQFDERSKMNGETRWHA